MPTTNSATFQLLLVDDDEDMLFLLKEMLKGEPVCCATATDGLLAKEHLEKHPIDLVITDINMPNMSGEELVLWMTERSLPAKCIIATGNPSLSSAVNALRAGAHDYIVKPLQKPLLLQTVRNALSHLALVRDKTHKMNEISRLYEELLNQKLAAGFTKCSMEEDVAFQLKDIEEKLNQLLKATGLAPESRAELSVIAMEISRVNESLAICLSEPSEQRV